MCQIYNIQVSATNDLLSIEKRSDKKGKKNIKKNIYTRLCICVIW